MLSHLITGFATVPGALTSGIRAYDMALRLHYDGVATGDVEPDLETALRRFLAAHRGQPTRIFCTYTAMMALRRMLAARFGLTDIGVDAAPGSGTASPSGRAGEAR